MGARLLFLRTERTEELKDYIINNLEGEISTFEDSLDKSGEDSTIVFITDTKNEYTDINDAKYIILVKEASSILLASILTSHLSGLIHRADLGPAILLMRVMGDISKVVNRLKTSSSYNAQSVSWEEGIRKGEKVDTLIAFTTQPLGEKVNGKDFMETLLLLPYPVNYVQKRLRAESIVFITQGMEGGSWYELRINIYDSRGNYLEHYRRLMMVLNQLEVGLVLGETWTRDHALMLYSVLAYQVRLFTLYPPDQIKKILVGLEYNEQGERLVDFDLYYRNKKVSWIDMNKSEKRRNKVEEGKKYRTELLERLPKDIKEKLLQKEFEIKSKID